MIPSDRQSTNAGILMVLGGILYMGLGLVGMQNSQDLSAIFMGGHYFLGYPVTRLDELKAFAITMQSGFLFLLGAAVSVVGLIVYLKALQPATPQAPTLSQ